MKQQCPGCDACNERRVPDFQSEEDEDKFWDTHSIYQFKPEPVRLKIKGRPIQPVKREKITMMIHPRLRARLQELAERAGVGYQTLMQRYLEDRVVLEIEAAAPTRMEYVFMKTCLVALLVFCLSGYGFATPIDTMGPLQTINADGTLPGQGESPSAPSASPKPLNRGRWNFWRAVYMGGRLGDAATTQYGLAHSLTEANPIMRLVTHSTPLLFGAEIVVGILGIRSIQKRYGRDYHHLVVPALVSAAVPVANIHTILSVPAATDVVTGAESGAP